MLVSINKTTSAVEIRSSSGSSLLMVLRLILMGVMTAAIPMSNKMFRMLLPITLPINISVLPLTRDEMATASSGAPVPKATIVRPMSCLLTLKLEATDEAPETSQSAPLMSRTKPATRNRIWRKMFASMFVFNNCVYIIA